MGWESGTWVDSQGNAASALSFKEVRRRSALESSPALSPFLLPACMYLYVHLPCISKGGIFPRELPCTTPPPASAKHAPCMPPPISPSVEHVLPSFTPPLSPLFMPSLSSQGLFGFTIVNNATNCDSGSTWSSTGLTPCTACSTCMESGVTSLCNRNTDAVCSTTVTNRSAATVTLTLVAASSVSDYNEQRKTNLQIKFALAAGVRAASTLSFPSPPTSSPLPVTLPLHLSSPLPHHPHCPQSGPPVLRRCASRCRLRDHHSYHSRSRRFLRLRHHERSRHHTWHDFGGRQLLPRNHHHFSANIHNQRQYSQHWQFARPSSRARPRSRPRRLPRALCSVCAHHEAHRQGACSRQAPNDAKRPNCKE